MTIRSVDMQVLLPKAGEVARMQQAERMENIQRQFDNKDAIVQNTFNTAKQVRQTTRGETHYVDEAPEKKNKKPKPPKKQMQNENGEQSSENETINHIDITI